MNKIISLGILGLLLFSMVGVMAQQNKIDYGFANQEQIQEMEQTQNRFQERYNFTCEANCTNRLLEDGTQRLEVREQRRFLFWNVESLEVYDIKENGELIQARYNIWSRLLNREKVNG